jgi:all-trans-retinol 13,14-reductase
VDIGGRPLSGDVQSGRHDAGAPPHGSVGTPYKRFRPTGAFDVIVVGSGIGGLGTAALLSRAAGRRVLVLERHYTAGGFTHVFHRPGFEWDVGLHYVGGFGWMGRRIGKILAYAAEGRLAWHQLPRVYDRVSVAGQRFDYVTGEAHLRAALVDAFPRERRAIGRYFRSVNRCWPSSIPFFSEKVLSPVMSRVLGGALRAPFLTLARRTTRQVLDGLGATPELAAVLAAQWGNYGLPPALSSFAIHALVTQHYFHGAAYPVGGASQIARSLLPTIERTGGDVVVGAAVAQVLVEGGKAVGVRMEDGQEFRAGLVVCAGGFRAAMPLVPRAASTEELNGEVSRIPPTPGHLCLYVGLKRAAGDAPLDPANVWVHPAADLDNNWTRFADDPGAPFPFLFISFPSAKDPTFESRYPDRETIEVMTLAPYGWFAEWADMPWKHRGAKYDELKQCFAERLLADLRRHVPQCAGRIETCELSTPLSTRHFAHAPNGETYGLAHSPARFEARAIRPRTPIVNLFMTGQDIATVGVFGAFVGAIGTASAILHRNLFLRPPRHRSA